MSMFMDTTTGEIYSGSSPSVDGLIETIKATEGKINELRLIASEAKSKLCAMAKFNGGVKTARIQGEKYRCKVEMPSKIAWNQKELKNLYDQYKGMPEKNTIISIASYKVDMKEYKKMINTIYPENTSGDFLKEHILQANLGYIGTPRVTIEEVNNG